MALIDDIAGIKSIHLLRTDRPAVLRMVLSFGTEDLLGTELEARVPYFFVSRQVLASHSKLLVGGTLAC